jgi:DNA-binding transcriptional ArsR family regulator
VGVWWWRELESWNPTAFIFLTRIIIGESLGRMLDVAVIEDPAAAEVSLDPIRARLLAELAEPASATMLAARVGLARQKVNYHLKALEQHGLVELVEERRKGNVTERIMQATAGSYVISPAALAAVAPDPTTAPDRLSARWLLAVAARLVRDVGALITGADRANKRVATFAVDGEIRFASAADRAAFAEELANTVTALVARYHDETAPGGRPHRLVIALHPSTETASTETAGTETTAQTDQPQEG